MPLQGGNQGTMLGLWAAQRGSVREEVLSVNE